jgi:hypothetical protein
MTKLWKFFLTAKGTKKAQSTQSYLHIINLFETFVYPDSYRDFVIFVVNGFPVLRYPCFLELLQCSHIKVSV